jgi:hypothetical protein
VKEVAPGRPPVAPAIIESFWKYLWASFDEHGRDVPRFAKITGVHRSSMWKMLFEKLPCGPLVRERIMLNLNAPQEIWGQFSNRWFPKGPQLPPARLAPSDPLWMAHFLHAHRVYPQAHNAFLQVFREAIAEKNELLAASAGAGLVWLYCDHDRYSEALQLTNHSIELLQDSLDGMQPEEVILSIQSARSSASRHDAVLAALHELLHLRGKILVSQVLQSTDHPETTAAKLEKAAEGALAQSLVLAEYLAIPTGRSLRWQAVLEANKFAPCLDKCEELLMNSEIQFGHDDVQEGYALRDRGIVYWYAGQQGLALKALLAAQTQLSAFSDPHAFAQTLLLRSKLLLDRYGDQARRLALAAGALHPYGHVLTQSGVIVATESDRRKTVRDVEDLMSGKEPFGPLHTIMERLARGQRTNIPLPPEPPGAPYIRLIENGLCSISDLLREITVEVTECTAREDLG